MQSRRAYEDGVALYWVNRGSIGNTCVEPHCRVTGAVTHDTSNYLGWPRQMLSRRLSCRSLMFYSPRSSPYPPSFFFFMAIFACICFSFLSALDGEEPSTWGGWAGLLHVVEWSATRAGRHEPDRKSERELAAWLVVLLTGHFPCFPN